MHQSYSSFSNIWKKAVGVSTRGSPSLFLPASMTPTLTLGSSERRAAMAQPAVPPPHTTKSKRVARNSSSEHITPPEEPVAPFVSAMFVIFYLRWKTFLIKMYLRATKGSPRKLGRGVVTQEKEENPFLVGTSHSLTLFSHACEGERIKILMVNKPTTRNMRGRRAEIHMMSE